MAGSLLSSDMGPAPPWNSAWSGLWVTSLAFVGQLRPAAGHSRNASRNWKLYFQMLPTVFMHGEKCFFWGTFQVAALETRGDLKPASSLGWGSWGVGCGDILQRAAAVYQWDSI